MIVIATMFVGCKKEEDSEPVNATEPISVSAEEMEQAVDEIIEDVSVEETKKDESGNDVVVGKDKDGNTVEVKTDKDGNITKTVTDKKTGKKTEETTKVTTTKKADTTQKVETTTKKPTANKTTTTTKPTSTAHTHDYKPVYKTEKVKVKDAYDEPVYEEVQAFYCSGCGMECVTESAKYGMIYVTFFTKHTEPSRNDGIIPLCPNADEPQSMKSGNYFGKPNFIKIQTGTVHHDAVYENKKVVDYYKCSCGATK